MRSKKWIYNTIFYKEKGEYLWLEKSKEVN